MNPVINKKETLEWEVKDVDRMNRNGRLSRKHIKTDVKWFIHAGYNTKDQIRYLEICLCQDHKDKPYQKLDEYSETDHTFKVFDSNGKVLHNSNDPCPSIKWSDLEKHFGSSRMNIIIQCDLSYKVYDFSKYSGCFTDGLFQVGNVEYHVNKRYFAAFSKFFHERFVEKDETTIIIEGVENSQFVQFLAALLPDPIQIDTYNYEFILELSQRFEISSLTKKCQDYFKNNESDEIIQQIKDAEKTGETSKIATILENIDRGRDLKIVMEDKNFKNFQDSTKLEFLNVAFNLL